jgi:hypothetical protein
MGQVRDELFTGRVPQYHDSQQVSGPFGRLDVFPAFFAHPSQHLPPGGVTSIDDAPGYVRWQGTYIVGGRDPFCYVDGHLLGVHYVCMCVCVCV